VLQTSLTANAPRIQPEPVVGARMKRRLTSFLVFGAHSMTPPPPPNNIEVTNAGLMLGI
jgi:hypothetical protein